MKRYGIYLSYSPTTDLRAQGLGQHLASFLAAALKRDDVAFSIACPSWTRSRLVELCEEYRIDTGGIDFVGPARLPLLLLIHARYQRWRRKARRRGRLRPLLRKHLLAWRAAAAQPFARIISLRSPWLIPLVALALLLGGIVFLVQDACRLLATGVRRLFGRISAARPGRKMLRRINNASDSPSGDARVEQLFRLLEAAETSVVLRCMAERSDIAAWYCPTSFWPRFNEVAAPRLQCVPDVVMTDFPMGFAQIATERSVEAFRDVDRAIAGGDHFVTYSEEIGRSVLAGRYHIADDRVNVIRHGTARLDLLIRVAGFANDEMATDAYCRSLLARALTKATGHSNPLSFASGEFRFLFYASQFRPNKNLATLLRAFKDLVQTRHISLKLVLTGSSDYPAFLPMARDLGVGNDVLCLHRLAPREVAACYRLARLAVNPSLAEGGMPFTFAEAVSVGTPVVMADLAVTREVLVGPELRGRTLFDPYDATAMADCIEAALADRAGLLSLQRRFFDDRLAPRTWDTVVSEHVAVLDRISRPAASADRA